MLDSERVFIDFVLKQFEQLEQLKTSADQDSKPLLGGAVLAKSYLTYLYESFGSETSCLDALNPLDNDA